MCWVSVSYSVLDACWCHTVILKWMLLFQVSWRTALPLAHTSEKQYWIKNFPDGENAGGGRDGGRGRNPHFHHRIFLLSEIALCGTKGFGLLRVLKLGQYRQRASLLKRSDFEVSADQSWLSNPYWFFKANKQVNINISFPHEKKTKQNKTHLSYSPFRWIIFLLAFKKCYNFLTMSLLFTCQHKQKKSYATQSCLEWEEPS